jgi:LEA14-like dessication related protein
VGCGGGALGRSAGEKELNRTVLFSKLLSGFVLMVGLVSCTALTSKPETPRITLVGLKLISVELLEQRYQVSLRVKNPNAFELPVRGIDFRLDINGETFADGVSNQSVDVPAYGENIVELEVSSNLFQVFRQFQSLQESQSAGFEYRVSGSMATGVYGQKLPFDYSGELQISEPTPSSRQQGL